MLEKEKASERDKPGHFYNHRLCSNSANFSFYICIEVGLSTIYSPLFSSSSSSFHLFSLGCLGWAIPSVAVLAVLVPLFLFVLSEGQGWVWSHVVCQRNRGRIWLKSCLSSSGIMGFPLTHSYLRYERQHNSSCCFMLNTHVVNGTRQSSISCLCKLWLLLSCTFLVDKSILFHS